jgi:hypothetical protein
VAAPEAAAAAPAAAAGAPEAALAQQLLQFASIQFTYGEVEDLKGVITAAEQLTRDLDPSHPSWAACLRLLLQLLFLDNSKPLHRQLLAFVRKQPPAKQAAAGAILCGLVQDRLAAAAAAATPAAPGPQQAAAAAAAVDGDTNGTAQGAPVGAGATTSSSSSTPLPSPTAAAVGAGAPTPTTTSTTSSSSSPPPLPSPTAAAVLVVAQAATSITWLPGAAGWLAPCAARLTNAVAEACWVLLGAAGTSGRPLGPQVGGRG